MLRVQVLVEDFDLRVLSDVELAQVEILSGRSEGIPEFVRECPG